MTLAARARTLSLWVRLLFFWMTEPVPRRIGLAILVVVLALGFTLRGGVTEREVRFVGLLLQILGIGTVAWGIRKTRALFGRPTLVGQFHAWLRRVPVYGGRVVFANVNITIPGASLHARGYASATVGPDASLEARTEALEKTVKLINERIDHTQNEMDQKFRSQADLLRQEEQTRTRDDQAIHEKLEASETGGLDISAIGALWLFVGVMLRTAAPEIAKCLN
jgi:hypothetical protein